ncbi:MAG: branched-chain amino acid ABC transporter substrate-binding protein [Spirochaetaceae bacterium]|nr:branched-chain amino acid ABC transporter substrate-binding protein [Spirochaetaceae bacterium]
MKRSTRIILVTLILALVFVGASFASAGSEDGDKEEVKLAFIGPLTGKYAKMGIGGRNSFQLAVDQQNASGDNQYFYVVEAIDDECVPAKGVQAATKAGSDPDVIAAASHYCSMVAITTTDVFHRFGLASMVWGAVLPAITYGNDYVEITRVNGTQVEQNEYNASLVVDELGFESFCIIHDTTDYGRGHMEYFMEAIAHRGIEPLSVDGVSIEQKDFTTILTQIKALEPEVIYFGGLTPIGVLIKNQMDKLGMTTQFLGTSGIKSDDFNATLAEHGEGVLCMLDGAPIDKMPGGQEFQAAYDAAGYADPYEAYGPFAYVAANLIIEAIEEVGPDRALVAERIDRSEGTDIIGKVHFNEYGQNDEPLVTAYVSQDGVWVPWGDSEYASGVRTLPGLAYRDTGTWENPYK